MAFRQQPQQRIRHVYGDLCQGDTLLEGHCMGRTGYRSSHSKRHQVSLSRFLSAMMRLSPHNTVTGGTTHGRCTVH
jgi:hypothetical protein